MICNQKQTRWPASLFRGFLISAILPMLVSSGCGDSSKGTAANSAGNSNLKNINANSGGSRSANQSESINIQEPDRYSVTMTISGQATVSDAPAPMSTQQLTLARFDADRRWGFVLPAPLGQVVYLEKSGLKYFVLLDRKQYIEITPDALGFQIGRVLTPSGVVERLKTRPHEKLGLEPVNGRTAIKYRSAESRESSTSSDVIFIDQETGLPLRTELSSTTPEGMKSRMIVEVRDVQLNPDRAQFDVPAGLKKVTSQEARQQVDGFATALRSLVDIINGTSTSSAVTTAPSAANRNASRSGR
jgi:outer membrane lipoprotein-sorting protein